MNARRAAAALLLGLFTSPLGIVGSAGPSAAATGATMSAWGSNSRGQLGDGTAADRLMAVPSGVPGALAIAGGLEHSLAVGPDHTAWAWGSNQYGQLGVGASVLASATPLPISGLTDVTAVAGSYFHSLAARADGGAWAWGDNHESQIGDGTQSGARLTPVQVVGLLDVDVVAVAAGGVHSVALASDGTVWTWGDNLHGQLADGTTVDRPSPVQVAGLPGIVAIAAGGYHTLALASDGTVWGWGENSRGQLGVGGLSQRSAPVQAMALTEVVGIAAGEFHSLAVRSDGTAWTWGNNEFGQLGRVGGPQVPTPGQVPGLAGVTAVAANAANGLHSVARRSDGTVWAWGWNGAGQLGDGTTITRSAPVLVSGLTDVTRIAAGGHHSLAVARPNAPPVAHDLSASTPEGTPVPIALSGSDPDGDTLEFVVDDGPSNGTLSGTAPALVYAPDSGFAGVDTFTYVASDDDATSAPATVTVVVRAATTLVAAPPRIEIRFLPLAITVRFSARLTETRNDAPLVGQNVVMIVDGQVACVATTGADGAASCTGPIQLLGSVGARGYDATYAGTSAYQSSTSHAGRR